MLPRKSYIPEKTLLIFEKGVNSSKTSKDLNKKSHNEIQHIREPYCRDFELLFIKIWNFCIFDRKKL